MACGWYAVSDFPDRGYGSWRQWRERYRLAREFTFDVTPDGTGSPLFDDWFQLHVVHAIEEGGLGKRYDDVDSESIAQAVADHRAG